jgi:hypothetical protein
MDMLHANIEEVEKTVFLNTANLFNPEVDLIFYDTTTASFHVDYEDDDNDPNTTLRKFGHAKEGHWAPQVLVALAVTRDGIRARSWVLPGNTADVTTLAKVRADLRGWNLGRAMFVADAGMNSTDNRAELAKAYDKYLLASHRDHSAKVPNGPSTCSLPAVISAICESPKAVNCVSTGEQWRMPPNMTAMGHRDQRRHYRPGWRRLRLQEPDGHRTLLPLAQANEDQDDADVPLGLATNRNPCQNLCAGTAD